jgi:hypothetical protein
MTLIKEYGTPSWPAMESESRIIQPELPSAASFGNIQMDLGFIGACWTVSI